MTRIIELWFYCCIWLKELIFVLEKYQPNYRTFSDSKNWSLFSIRLTELKPFLNVTQRIEPCFQYHSKNWTLFLNMSQRIELFFKCDSMIQRINWSFLFSMTQRIEPFFTWLKDLNFFTSLKDLSLFYLVRPKELNCLW